MKQLQSQGKEETARKANGSDKKPHTKEALFATMAGLLAGTQVDSKAVEQALQLLCENFSFSSGVIYEQGICNRLTQEEHWGTNCDSLPEMLCEAEFPLRKRAVWIEKSVFYAWEKESNAPHEAQILKMLKAQAVVLAAITDESKAMCGFVALRREECQTPCALEDASIKVLDTLLPMFTHYVATRMLKKKIDRSRTALENLLDSTGIDIYVNDFQTHEILYVNESMAAPYGGKQCFDKKLCWQVLFPEQNGSCEFCPQKNLLDENGVPKQVYSWDYQRALDGSWFRVFSAAFYWEDGRLAHVVSSADISENKRNEALIETLANYDHLTGLPNRRMLVQECERRIEKATRTEQGYTMFFDIDGFKKINDTLGHDAGDEFLVQLGAFFSNVPLLKDSFYRNGGDEFVAILGGETMTKDHVRHLTHFIQDRFKEPWKLKKGTICCGTSIGVACYPEDGTTAEVLLQVADQAMYQVKKSGGGGVCFGYQLKGQDTHDSQPI